MAALSIAPWPTSSNTEGLKPPDLPPPASIVSRHSWGEGVTDVCLDSGLRIILKPTDFLDDDIQFSAFAWTGISQAPQELLMHARLARSVADELGWAGIPREELLDLLAGLRLSASPSIGAYSRGIAGDCSPTDLESLLQLAYRLFTSQVNVDMERLATLHSLLRDSVVNRDKDPDGVFSRKVAEVTTCAHPYFRPMELDDLDGLAAEGEAQKIAKVFDSAFCGVDGWTLVMVGNLVVDEVLPLCCQYLGIPADAPAPDGGSPAAVAVAGAPLFSGQRDDITPLEVRFPDASAEVRVVRPMAGAPRSRACISFPLALERKKGCLESLRRLTALDVAISVMDKCLRETLRFDKGGVYGASVSTAFGSSPPLPDTPLHGVCSIDFDCDPARQPEMIAAALAEFEKRRSEAPSAEQVSSTLEGLRRGHEESLRTNGYWVGGLTACVMSTRYEHHKGDLARIYRERQSVQREVWAASTPETVRATLAETFPDSCLVGRRTVVTLFPEAAAETEEAN